MRFEHWQIGIKDAIGKLPENERKAATLLVREFLRENKIFYTL